MKQKSWLVKMKCVVTKEVVVVDCTEEQAHENPFHYALDETEVDMQDWEVISVTPND